VDELALHKGFKFIGGPLKGGFTLEFGSNKLGVQNIPYLMDVTFGLHFGPKVEVWYLISQSTRRSIGDCQDLAMEVMSHQCQLSFPILWTRA
jgi:hypothetical protein